MRNPLTHSKAIQPPLYAALRSHIPSLDGIRGLAVLLVIVHHFAGVPKETLGFAKTFLRVFEFGWCGVDLFFVLSGFLITGILINAKGQDNPIRTFYARRTVRIFPLYYLSLAVLLFLIAPMSRTPEAYADLQENQIWYWTYLTNVLIVLDVPLGQINAAHFWSLAVEEQFYMVWPFVVLFASVRNLRRICVGMIATAFLFRCTCFAAGWGTSPAYVLTISRIDALGMGALISTILREPTLKERLMVWIPKLLPVLIGALLIIVAVQRGFHRGPLMMTVGLLFLAGIFGLVIAIAAMEKQITIRGLLESRFLGFLGKYSYAMYVFHPFIISWMVSCYPDIREPKGSGLATLSSLFFFTVCGLFVTAITALISWNLVEKWFLKLKVYFEPKPLRDITNGRPIELAQS